MSNKNNCGYYYTMGITPVWASIWAGLWLFIKMNDYISVLIVCQQPKGLTFCCCLEEYTYVHVISVSVIDFTYRQMLK